MPDGDDDYDSFPSVQSHVHSPPRFQRPSSRQLSDYLPIDRISTLTSSSQFSGPLLSALTYQPEPLSEPYVSSNTRADDSRERTPSPDPSEFYRPYTTHDAQNSSGVGSLLPAADVRPGMTTITSAPRSPEISKQFDSYRRNRSTPRSFQLRSTSGGSGTSPSDGASRSQQPGRFIGARSRQASFKDLVERFNKNIDEVPPVPVRPTSAFSSRAASPAPSFNNRSRSGTQTRESAHRHPPDISPPTSFPPLPNHDRPELSQSSLYQPQIPPYQTYGGGPSRRPLFGELLTIDTAVNDRPGHGIHQAYHRRRGSESSISSPHPFNNSQGGGAFGPVISPSSPTAWYLGYTHSLESVNKTIETGRNHRRSRSDASWTTLKPSVAGPLGTQMAVSSSQDTIPTMNSESSHTKSRIPVASRRGSRASESSTPSSPSTRTGSAIGFHPHSTSQIPLAPKGSSRLPKPLNLSTSAYSPERKVPVHNTVKSPGRRNVVHNHGSPRQVPDKGSLKVYVSAPPPKLSPPLRSSRPRQPVSAASTAASRAKVVDRVSRFQTSQNDDSTRNPRTRTRKPPELGNVDFAARRQRIQQAFNKSVQETVKKEEEAAERRRLARYKRDEQVRSMLIREGELRKMASMESASTPVQLYPNDGFSDPQPATPGEMTTSEPTNTDPQNPVPSLSVITPNNFDAHQPEAVPERLADSPTLGASTTPNIHPAPVDPSDIPPSSAVTTATNDTGSTNFDPEPQVGLDHHESHRDLLSRIMQLRESSSSSECDEDEDDDDDNDLCDEEADEKGSIRIMLDPTRATFFLDGIDRGQKNDLETSKNAGSDTTGHDDVNRWSMASWASSTREQQSSLDSQCDAEDDAEDDADEPRDSIDHESRPLPQWNESTNLRRQATLDSFHSKPKSIETHKRQRSHPDNLIRQGGWDSKRVTQLYLQELARGGLTESLGQSWETFDENRNEQPDSNGLEEPVVLSHLGDVTPDRIAHRASLNLRDDWESASPSIADWIQVATEDEPPVPPPKDDIPPANKNLSEIFTSSSPQVNNSWNGLGLAIHVQSPVDESRGTLIPPMPTYSPPPAPKDDSALDPAPQSVSPSIYTSQPPSSNFSSDPFPTIEEHVPVRHSEDSYLTQTGFTPSPPTVASSATSQYQIAPPDAGEAPVGSPTPEQKQLKQRRNVIKELVDTEYTYGRDMKVVDDIYKGTSSSCLDLSADDVRTLFANSDQIVQFSMNFLDALKQSAKSVYVMPKSARWNSKKGQRNGRTDSPAEAPNSASGLSNLEQDQLTFVGHVFMENMTQMEKVYTEYLKNHDAANKKLQVLQRNPKVEIWLKECRDWAADLTEAWNLDALLVKPVQRLVKYPLLLNQLINATPEHHPDHAALVQALEAVTKISVRINDLKKRADVVGQVVSNRKRKESDVRSGFTKAFGRRTEKLRQQVGLSEMYEDTEYNSMANRFNEHFFQLQVVMRDVEMYTREIKSGMEMFNNYVVAIQGCLDVAQSNYTEIESKWHRLRMFVREIINVALPEHVATVRKGVIDPMLTLLKLYEGPQKVMTKRNKRLLDYARYKSVIDRGDKPDKRTIEQGEQFSVLNDALKDELPRLFSLTAKLMEACLKKFVSIQEQWYQILQQKLGPILDRFPGDISGIVSDWSADFSFVDAQIISLALCNGTLLSEAGNLVNFNAPLPDGPTSPRRPSTVTSNRTASGTFESSPKVSYDLGQSYGMDGQTDHSNGSHSYIGAPSRTRASSSLSNVTRAGVSAESVNGTGSMAQALSSGRPSTGSTGRQTESFHTAPRLSLDMPFMRDSLLQETRTADSTASPARFSGFFSSAMPMSDSPMQESAAAAAPSTNPNPNPKVLFLAASLYEFNIDKSRREAGYPYLTYTEGEVFDVIAEKGELWLAKNQDDPSGQVGWIWTQHFAKLPG
ncbi:Rho guanyl nucleotide exchange factor, putative [Talaromyces stipitatus ATCC 10500]|uniref:Dynamin-binding protein n=1 Tax=Talaromyces stipitatus (strain ATCC 10500 / CBS 375.48 / QM 6759 / NRRL 1006) TaxID=441959 RepID=B8MCJ0_TALSN|nr:Rho guanyl nucleotide exchange factor, putative [Talaromyces stipitatus ATCC 10500]EED18806.1 Rho guanyl nucleotide exchange factor, putative [Talaromyces stipitatus ATCC 10500]